MSFLKRLLRKTPPARASSPAPAVAPSSTNVSPVADETASLPFGSRLLELAFDSSHPQHRSAQKRLVELIDSGAVSVEQLPWDSARRRAVLAITAATADPENFNRVATRIDDPSIWKELAIDGTTAKLRQVAATRLEGEDDLRAVVKAARERDKNVYRVAKQKLDAINAVARREAEQRAHVQSLVETIERQSFKPFDNAYVAAVDHLQREWRAVEVEIPAELKARAETAFDRAREVVTEQIRLAGMRAAREAAIANAAPIRESVIDELRKFLAALYSVESFDTAAHTNLTERLTKLEERWRDTAQHKAPTAEETQTFETLHRAVGRTAKALADAGTLPQLLATAKAGGADSAFERIDSIIAARGLIGDNAPALVAEAEALTKTWREQRDAERASVAEAERQVGQLIRRAQHALADGRSRQAFGIRRSIDAKIGRLPDVPKALAERLAQLDSKLQEIQDWRSFAVTPKRSELIAQMQALIGVDQDPVDLADEIKRLQEEWRSLTKGSVDSDEDWQKFHEAAQAAYAPCKAYFETQAQERERNLEKRKALVARLERFEATTDWEHPEWRNVANVIRQAKQEWRTAGTTERAATRPIEKRFDELIAAIQARLDREYAANIERKQQLVKQAARLAESTDLAQAASEVKRLQSAWRHVGLTPHAEGQRLWEEFKGHCDAVFEKRREEHSVRVAELEQNEEQALSVCIELETLAERTGEALYSLAARARELRDAFDAIGELPRDKAHEIQRRFRRAVEGFEHAIVRERRRETDVAWENFFAAGNRIRETQLAPEADSNVLREYIDAVQQWPKGGKQAIEQRLAASVRSDVEANAEALRDLAIRAEIATGASTPEPDQMHRRAMQLQALVKGIGRGHPTPQAELESLAFEWVAAGPVPDDVYEPLWARFWRCWQLARK
jgi:exonuclease SbcC